MPSTGSSTLHSFALESLCEDFLKKHLHPTSLKAHVGDDTTRSTFTDSTMSDGTCELSPRARALSTFISAAVGSVIGGATNGQLIAFHTSWICWLGSIRIVMTGVWFVYEAFRLQRAAGGDQFHAFYGRIPVVKYITNPAKRESDVNSAFRVREEFVDQDGGANLLGWIGWAWVAVYEPIVNTLWLAGNWSAASGELKFARAISVGVSALPLTVDTKARYGDALEKSFSKPIRWLFTIISAVACLYLGLLALVLLCLAVADWRKGLEESHTSVALPIFVAVIYTLCMIVWASGSFRLLVPHDEGLGVHNWKQCLAGLGVGVFGIPFVAFPSLIVMFTSPTSPGRELSAYIACQSVAIWRKAIAFLP